MKPYGHQKMHCDGKHRMGGDAFNNRHPHTHLQTKKFLRRFKKIARRIGKDDIKDAVLEI
jgi:hypothetical protein